MSDTLDSRRAVRAILKAAKNAGELLAAKDREIIAAKNDAAHWQAKHEAFKARVDRAFELLVLPDYQRGPGMRRCCVTIDRQAMKVADERDFVLYIATRLAEELRIAR